VLLVGALDGCSAKQPAETRGSSDSPAVAASPTERADAASQGATRARVERLLDSRRNLAGSNDYLVGPGDVLKIAVFEVPEMDRTARVAESGDITLPLLGNVPVVGLTVQGVHDRLGALLGRKYVVNPQVDVHVETFASQRVAMMGRVEKPGIYPLSRSASRIVDLVGQAGGLTPEAARRIELYPVEERPAGALASPPGTAVAGGTTIDRAAIEGRHPIVIDLFDLMDLSDPISSLALRDGDVVFVPDRGDFFVGGEVKKPGKYGLSDTSTLITAIAEAGGLGDFPITDQVLLVRHPSPSEKVTIALDFDAITAGDQPDVAIHEGDQVIVHRSLLRAGVSKVVETMGRFIGIGLSAPL
jgi:polysaccharide export outer membrane protein